MAPWCYTTDIFTEWEYCDPIGTTPAPVASCSATCKGCDTLSDRECKAIEDISYGAEGVRYDGLHIVNNRLPLSLIPMTCPGIGGYTCGSSKTELCTQLNCETPADATCKCKDTEFCDHASGYQKGVCQSCTGWTTQEQCSDPNNGLTDNAKSECQGKCLPPPAFFPLEYNEVLDYRLKSSAPDNTYLCGVKAASIDPDASGVSKLWLKYCNKYNWNTQTEVRVWEDQNAREGGSFGSHCAADGDCAGTNTCVKATSATLEGLKSAQIDQGYCVYPAAQEGAWVDCPEGEFVDGWNSVNTYAHGLKGLKISCSDPVKKTAGAPVSRSWSLVGGGAAVPGELDRKYVHSKKYVCGMDLVDRALLGDSKGIDDAGVKYCSYVPTNGSVDIKYMGTPLRRGTYVDAGDEATFNDLLAATAQHRDEFIIHRECNTCGAAHKEIYYKRLRSPPEMITANAYVGVMSDFSTAKVGTAGTDFNLYSTLQEALDGVSPW